MAQTEEQKMQAKMRREKRKEDMSRITKDQQVTINQFTQGSKKYKRGPHEGEVKVTKKDLAKMNPGQWAIVNLRRIKSHNGYFEVPGGQAIFVKVYPTVKRERRVPAALLESASISKEASRFFREENPGKLVNGKWVPFVKPSPGAYANIRDMVAQERQF